MDTPLLKRFKSDVTRPPQQGEVHLWQFSLNPSAEDILSYSNYLSPDEVERAHSYVFERDRVKFIAARGKLRAILGSYIACAASEIEFGYGANGKPFLLEPDTGPNLQFNLSHSRNLGLCAVARDRQIGVDLEWKRPDIDILGIARSTFSLGEQLRLEALPAGQQLDAFYACWTRKEAYIKARGDGLAYPLDAFDVSLEPHGSPELLRSREGPSEIRRWVLQSIGVAPGYAAALVVERPLTRLTLKG